TAADPIRGFRADSGAFQFYAYADNDPANRTDPSGKWTILEIKIALAALFALAAELSTLFHGGGFWDGLASFGKAFIEGLIIAEAFEESLALAGYGITVGAGLALSGSQIYSASDNLVQDVKNNNGFSAIGDGIDLLVGLAGAYLGFKFGNRGKAKGSGGDTP